MNDREMVRKWAQQSDASILISMLFLFLVLGGMIALFPSARLDIVCYFALYPVVLSTIVSKSRTLAKEIVRLEEKIEELERRIP